jgi:hypothetical protein
MEKNKARLLGKIRYLEAELVALEGYHYVAETYAYLQCELDYYLMQLKKIEVAEELARIDAEPTRL